MQFGAIEMLLHMFATIPEQVDFAVIANTSLVRFKTLIRVI